MSPPASSNGSEKRSPDAKRVLVAGCGYVGSRLAERLVERGCEVFTLRRSPAAFSGDIVALRADLTRIETLGVLPDELDAIVYSAGPSSASGGPADEAAYRAAYVDGVGNLVRCLRDRGDALPRIVFCSSTAVYAQERGEWVDEASPTRPRRWNGERLLDAERLLQAQSAEAIVVRLGGIYGPGRRRLIDSVLEGAARVRPDVHFTNRIHREDAAGILGHLALAEAPRHRCYLGVDDEPADEADVLAFLADRLGVEKPPAAAPGEIAPRRAGSKRCSNARIRAEGYEFAYPSFRDGYAEMLSDA